MARNIDFSTFEIRVRPSPETNDHQVRLLGDGGDLIDRFWLGMVGLDPDDLLLEPSRLRPGGKSQRATVARCSCGEAGCDSVEVEVRAEGDLVLWSDGRHTFRFPAQQYEAEINRAQADTSWETPERTTARLVRAGVGHEALAENGLQFEWASGRVEPGRFTVSLRLDPGPYQLLVSLPFSDETPPALAEATLRLLRDHPGTWKNVRYFPQAPGLQVPPPLLWSGRGT